MTGDRRVNDATARRRAGLPGSDAAPPPIGPPLPPPHPPPPEAGLTDPCTERELVGERLREAATADRPHLDVFLSGGVFMDMIFTGLPAMPPPGAEFWAEGLGSAPGGIANPAVAMSRLGLTVGMAAAFGDDVFGSYLWRTLRTQEGVDLTWSRRLASWPSPVTVSFASPADRSMVTYGEPLPFPPDELVRNPPEARTCFVELGRTFPEWAKDLRARGTTVVADVGWDPTERWPEKLIQDLGHVDVFLPNAVEAMAYTRTDSPEAALEALAERVPVVVVKLGAQGAIALDRITGESAREPALPVEALDPTGAGDVFVAGFVFGTLAGWSLSERLRFANLVAGLSVRHFSGSLGSPCWGEISAFGESAQVPPDVLESYGFIVPYIPESPDDTVTRARPTVRHDAGDDRVGTLP